MDINNIILNKEDWKISNGLVFKKKLVWIPIMNCKKDYIEIYFDDRLSKEILWLIPKISQSEFYLVSPLFSNPKFSTIENHKVNIEHYFCNYAKTSFFYGFKKINFNIIDNIIFYCKKFDSMDIVKDCYDYVNKSVQAQDYDWYTNKSYYIFSDEIREEFNSLYRQIKIRSLLS